MNEPKPDGASHEYVPSVSPYNLDNFPAYKAELLAGTSDTGKTAAIEKTFDPDNVELLTGLLDGSPANEHQDMFDELYPALSSVYEHDQGLQRLESHQQRYAAVKAAENEYSLRPGYYRNYWQTRLEREDSADSQLVGIYRRNQDSLNTANEKMLRSGASLVEASDWYLKLGSLSQMNGGEAALVYAANLPFATKTESKKFSLDEQRLNAGCMLSEASLANERSADPDVARQQSYEAQARKVLEPLATNEKSSEGRSAFIHLNDLSMRAAARLIRGSVDPSEIAEAVQQANEAQKQLGKLLESTHAAFGRATPNNHGELRGAETELTVLWLNREYLVNDKSRQFGNVSIHQAFPRQDWPQDGLAPNHEPRQSYDVEMILQGEQSDGSTKFNIVPIQVKSSQSGKGDGYVPQIVMMVDDNRDTAGVVQAIMYRDQGIAGGSEKVASFADAMARAMNSRIYKNRTAA